MSGLYVDSSTALKRIFLEDGTETVGTILRTRITAGELVATSTLAWVEVARAISRSGTGNVEARLAAALSGIAELPLDDGVLERARTIGPVTLRTRDAIHLASAVAMGVTALLTFDARLADAAGSIGVRPIP